MVHRLPSNIADGDLGGFIVCSHHCPDERWCPVFVLQLVSSPCAQFFLFLTRTLTWSWFHSSIIALVGTIFIVLSLGEIASIYPTAGGTCSPWPLPYVNHLLKDSLKTIGQYHWVYCLTPKSYQSTASWFTGWISIGGQLVFSASAAFAAGLQFQALITLNNLDSYTPTRWQGMLFYWLILAYSTSLNIWGSKILPHTNAAAGQYRALPKYEIET